MVQIWILGKVYIDNWGKIQYAYISCKIKLKWSLLCVNSLS